MINLKDFSKYPTVIYRTSKQFIKENSPTILSALAVGGVVTTAIMAGKGGIKAHELLEHEKDERFRKAHEEYINDPNMLVPNFDSMNLTVLETLRIAGPCYIPAAVMGAATIGCILGANSINLRRQAALASLYSLSEATLKEYKEKTKELVGEKKAQKIEDEQVQDIVAKSSGKNVHVFNTRHGDTLFYDTLSGRYFLSDIEFVRRVENDIKGMIYGDMCATLNDFYYQLDLDGILLGEDCGWNVEHMIDLKFTGALTKHGEPCIAIGYNIGPVYNYQKMYH